MSTNADCYFTELKSGEWTYSLQEYPYGENENYETYGPFPTFRRADAHLRENHANPGGYSTRLQEDHVHDYRKEKVWGYDTPIDRCWTCDHDKPVLLDCGVCEDHHKNGCDEYVMTISFRISRGRAADYLVGEKTIHKSVDEAVANTIGDTLKRHDKLAGKGC